MQTFKSTLFFLVISIIFASVQDKRINKNLAGEIKNKIVFIIVLKWFFIFLNKKHKKMYFMFSLFLFIFTWYNNQTLHQ
jgi:hypothetical protein